LKVEVEVEQRVSVSWREELITVRETIGEALKE
jgi:hypothetical protein